MVCIGLQALARLCFAIHSKSLHVLASLGQPVRRITQLPPGICPQAFTQEPAPHNACV